MRNRSLRSVTAASALVLTSLVAAACSSAPVRPLAAQPVRAAAPSSTPSVTPTRRPAPTSAAPRANPTRPAHGPPACRGAVIYQVDTSVAGPARWTVCIAVGGVVRVHNLGPDGMTETGPVSCQYEAAVHFCRLIGTGTAKFTIAARQGTRQLTVLVRNASSPPKPSPACQGAVKVTLDASEGGPPWGALCLKVGAVLRVENLGPGELSASPANPISCWYEAGVHECRFVRPGTVRFTMTGPQSHSLTVVVVR